MHFLLPADYPLPIQVLAAELHQLEVLLGRPDAPPDIEPRVIRLAHDLRNEIHLHDLSRQVDALKRCHLTLATR